MVRREGQTDTRTSPVSKIEVLALIGLPAVLILVHVLLPADTKASLWFRIDEPNLVTAYTASYVHQDWGHLLSNLLGYLVLVPCFILYDYWGRRQLFWMTVGTLLLVTPLLVAAVNYLVLYRHWGLLAATAHSKGFLGIVCGFGGMVLASAGLFAANRSDGIVAAHVVAAIFLATLGLLTVTTGVVTPVSATVTLVGLTAISAGALRNARQRYDRGFSSAIRSRSADSFIVGQSGLIFIVFIPLVIPANPVQANGFVNVFAHLAGLAGGVVFTLLVHLWQSEHLSAPLRTE